MINVESTIISQYGNSASITQLVRGIDHYLDPRADLEAFYNLVWNVDTATTWGLDVWGKIVGVPRYIEIPSTIPIPPDAESRTFYIPDDDYRGYILFKAATNITNCSAPSINRLLINKFKDVGRAYVNDLGAMSMRYLFEFNLSYWEEALFEAGIIIPRATGVSVDVFIIPPTDVFGFFGTELQPFNRGTFTSTPRQTVDVLGFFESDFQPFNQAPFTDRSN